jgi:ribosome recycling factor
MFDENIYKQKMNKTFEAFAKDLSALRTGRANAAMLDVIKVDVYGQKIPVNQLGTITVADPRTLSIQVWDQNNVVLIDSSLRKSEMGLNPQIDGRLIRIPIPNLNEERRNELKKKIKNMAEKSKISVRNIRREANDVLKAILKEKKISEDEKNKFEKEIQKITDQEIKKIDERESQKEKEIMTV